MILKVIIAKVKVKAKTLSQGKGQGRYWWPPTYLYLGKGGLHAHGHTLFPHLKKLIQVELQIHTHT